MAILWDFWYGPVRWLYFGPKLTTKLREFLELIMNNTYVRSIMRKRTRKRALTHNIDALNARPK